MYQVGSVGINISGQPLDPSKQYVVVEYKYCERCTTRFIREHVELKRVKSLVDPNLVLTFDPNKYCTRCENEMVKDAQQSSEEMAAIIDNPIAALAPRDNSTRSINERKRLSEKMMRECFRKEAFPTMEMAHRIANRSRKRHKGKSPCVPYRCQCDINPAAFTEFSDEYELALLRQAPHWHIGGRMDRKL